VHRGAEGIEGTLRPREGFDRTVPASGARPRDSARDLHEREVERAAQTAERTDHLVEGVVRLLRLALRGQHLTADLPDHRLQLTAAHSARQLLGSLEQTTRTTKIAARQRNPDFRHERFRPDLA
jgi:hypothetical protein